jgi:hypothetical protein
MKTLTLTLLCLALTAQAQPQNWLQLVWTGYGEAGNNYYGAGSTGGDFNNDGYSDVLIGAGGWGNVGGNGNIGRNYLYLGSPQFFDTATFIFQGDTAWDNYDWDVSNVADVNGNCMEDLLIPGSTAWYGGYVELFFGSQPFDTLPDWRLQKSAPTYGTFFGQSTDSVGDVNGDGWSDMAISGGEYDLSYRYIEIYHGGPGLDTIADWRCGGTSNGTFTVIGLGDVNGDGFDDILAYTAGPSWIFFGGNPMDTIPDLGIYTPLWSGGAVGDVNADGYNDVLFRLHSDPPESSHAAVYFGSADMDTLEDVILEGILYPEISSAEHIAHGDINGDGISDIVCEEGMFAAIYLGSPWFNGTPDWWFFEFYMYYGFAVNAVGDVNGDGCDEILVGEYTYEYPFNQGMARLFAGNDTLTDLGAGVESEELQHVPGWFKLYQNYPNPFNSSASVHFELGIPSSVNLNIYDIQGKEIKRLIVNKEMLPGGYNVSWNGRNEQNQPVSSGIYLLELQVDQYRQMKKMVLIR